MIARSYLPGDAMKRLNWKATAHRGELMVRQEERQVNPRAAVYLDCDPSTLGTARDRVGDWEHSRCWSGVWWRPRRSMTHLVGEGCIVGLRSSDRAIDRRIGDGHDTLSDAMLDLAVVEPGDHGRRRRGASRTVCRARHRPSRPRPRRSLDPGPRPGQPVHAFVAEATRPEALERLDGTRWSIVTYRVQDDQAERWLAFDRVVTRALG